MNTIRIKKFSIFFMLSLMVLQTILFPINSLASNAINNQQIDKDDYSFEEAVIIAEEDFEVPLYENDTTDSDILLTLSNGDSIKVIEQMDSFSLVEVEKNEENTDDQNDGSEESDIWQGYLENSFIELLKNESEEELEEDLDNDFSDDSEENNEEDLNQEQNSDDSESDNELTDEEKDEDEVNNEVIEEDSDSDELDSAGESTNDSEQQKSDDEEVVTEEKEDEIATSAFRSASVSLTGVAKRSPTNIRTKASTKSKVLKKLHIGEVFNHEPYSENWHVVKVNVNGKTEIGYIHKKHFTNVKTVPESFKGVAKKSPTNIRTGASTKSKVLKKLPIGSVINYESFSKNWNQITVTVNGEKQIGYLHKKHVTNVNTKPVSLKGVAKKSPTNIRTGASTKSKVLKKLPIGSVINYESFSKNWNQITVTVNGEKQIGYLHNKHVTNVKDSKPVSLKGVAKKAPTNIRAGASTKSKVLKKLPIGSVVNYKTFSKNWYEITVTVNGKNEIGYLHRKHVTNVKTKPKNVTLVTKKSPTNVRAGASTKAKIIKKYNFGQVVNVKTFSKNWYEVTTKVNGKSVTGYMHRKHIDAKAIKTSKYNITLDQALSIQHGKKPNYNHKIATKNQIKNYLDPKNMPAGSNDYYQFLVLSQPAGTKAADLNNKILAGKGTLNNTGKYFIEAAKEHQINELYLISHAILETGHGTSALASGTQVGKYKSGKNKDKPTLVTNSNINKLKEIKTVYNMFGIGAFDNQAHEAGSIRAYELGWTSPKKAIIGGAEWIGDGYINKGQNTLYKMRWHPDGMVDLGHGTWHQYATDIAWASKQTSNLKRYYDLLDTYTLVFDVPSYK